MSSVRQRPLTPADERFLIVRTMSARCAPGLRTTSPTKGWHRLVIAAQGIILVKTAEGQWSAPARNAVWVPAGVRAELETFVETNLRVFYIRARAPRGAAEAPQRSQTVTADALLREVLARIAELSALDRRIHWHVALVQLLLHGVRLGAIEPLELVWPRDPRVARVAARVQADPADQRCLGTVPRPGREHADGAAAFPLETGLTFESWRARVRFLHATRLLAEGRKVGDVAARCGYRSASAFVTAFSRFAGMTPGQFCRS